MAQAFTREIDDAPPPPPPERPISPHPNRVTRRGARLIEEAIAGLRDRISAADTDAEAGLARDLRYWLARRANMQIVDPGPCPEVVGFGVTATILRRGERTRIRIVGEDESDPANGLLGWTAPLARALEGAEPGDDIAFEMGGRSETIEVLAIGAGEDEPHA